jgi:SAM-dependent methyltransferase
MNGIRELKEDLWLLKNKMRTYRNWWASTSLTPYDKSSVESIEVQKEQIIVNAKNGKEYTFRYEENYRDFLFTIAEIFIWKTYNPPHSIANRDVVDIGAGIGDSSIWFAAKGARKVYAYDIDPLRCKEAMKNIKFNNMQNKIKLFNHPYKNLPLKNAILKVDCDGCEYKLFDKIDLRQFDDVVMEYHKGYEPISTILQKNGFNITIKHAKPFSKSGYIKATRAR